MTSRQADLRRGALPGASELQPCCRGRNITRLPALRCRKGCLGEDARLVQAERCGIALGLLFTVVTSFECRAPSTRCSASLREMIALWRRVRRPRAPAFQPARSVGDCCCVQGRSEIRPSFCKARQFAEGRLLCMRSRPWRRRLVRSRRFRGLPLQPFGRRAKQAIDALGAGSWGVGQLSAQLCRTEEIRLFGH